MKHTIRTIALAVLCIGLGLAPAVNAAHFTTYLADLDTLVAERLADTSTLTDEQVRALNSAQTALARNSKTLSSDLSILTTAGTALNNAFPEDETVLGATESAFGSFRGEAAAQVNAIQSSLELYTGEIPKNVNNSLTQIENALATADNTEATLAERSRALNLALNKLRAATAQVGKLIKAPSDLSGRPVTLSVRIEGERKPYVINLGADGTYADGEESGTWSYERTSSNTATVTLNPTLPEGAAARTFELTFKNPTKGTLTSDSGTGTFSVKKVK